MQDNKSKHINEHLANERTFLAWIRTSIGIMAFGFVVVKFSLFVKQFSLLLDKQLVVPQRGYSAIVGIVLVAVGAVTSVLAYLRYLQAARQLELGTYRNSSLLLTVLTAFVFLISGLLIAYLVEST